MVVIYKIIQTLCSSNFIYKVRYIIKFFMVYLYWALHILHWINSFGTKIKKLRLDGTFDAKLNSNGNQIYTLN